MMKMLRFYSVISFAQLPRIGRYMSSFLGESWCFQSILRERRKGRELLETSLIPLDGLECELVLSRGSARECKSYKRYCSAANRSRLTRQRGGVPTGMNGENSRESRQKARRAEQKLWQKRF